MPIDKVTKIFVIDWSSIININRLIDINCHRFISILIDHRFYRLVTQGHISPNFMAIYLALILAQIRDTAHFVYHILKDAIKIKCLKDTLRPSLKNKIYSLKSTINTQSIQENVAYNIIFSTQKVEILQK